MNPADLRARVMAEVGRTPSPTRSAHKRGVLVMSAIGAVVTASLFLVMGGMAPGTRPLEMIAATAGCGLLAVAVLTRVSSGGSMLGRPRSALLAAIVVTAPLLSLVVLATAMAWPEHTHAQAGGRVDLLCGLISVVQGALPLVLLIVPRRGTDPVHPAMTGAALGMTAGAWTVVMAYLRCPHAAPMHCILAHVVPTLLLTLLGAGLGSLLLRVRVK